MLNRMNVSWKLAAACAIFCVPISALLYDLVAGQQSGIQAARKEIVGNAYFTAAAKVQQALYQYRDGAAHSAGEVQSPNSALDGAIDGLAKAQASESGGMDTAALERVAEDAARKIASNDRTVSFDDAITALRSLMSRIGDDSGLILDPDLDSFYTMDALTGKVPDIVDGIEAIDWDATSTNADTSKEKSANTLVESIKLTATSAALSDDLEAGYRGSADGSLKQHLGTQLATTLAALDAFNKRAAAAVDQTAPPADAARLGQEALSQTLALRDEMAPELDRLLSARIAGFNNDLYRALGITLLLFAVSLVAIVAVIRYGITRPLIRLTTAMLELAAGKTDTLVPNLERGDELGAMAKAVQVFKETMVEADTIRLSASADQQRRADRADQIEGQVTRFESAIAAIVGTVSSAAVQLRETAQTMSSTSSLASQQSATVAGASEMASGNVTVVAAATEQLSASVGEIARQIISSTEMINDAETQATRTNLQVEELSVAAEKIGDVVHMISDIASQTNLLALNATIEAARAGEAGRGFAVVASEVKMLASQTSKATDEIGSQIRAMQEATRGSVAAIRGIVEIIGRVKDTSGMIASAVEQQGSATQEIARNSQEAAVRANEVTSNITSVSDAAQATGAAAGQMLDSALELNRNSALLEQHVASFLRDVRAA
jgi:methyl-accepting chemotaxis protein